jgi:hypothetical protein
MPKQTPLITFKEIKRDNFPDPFIEVVAGRPKASKKLAEQVEWQIVNHSSYDIDVAVVDFYADKGGTPFSSGFVPEPSTTAAKFGALGAGKPGKATIGKIKDIDGVVQAKIDVDGDVAIYKYTVLARTAAVAGPPAIPAGPWFLVRDPELEIEP